jgi:hypothetical protein
VFVGTGDSTEVGKISDLIAEAEELKTASHTQDRAVQRLLST